jgi:hypothetical protein
MPVHDDRAVHERPHLLEVLTVGVGEHHGRVGEGKGNVRHRPLLVLADLKDSGGERVVVVPRQTLESLPIASLRRLPSSGGLQRLCVYP